MNIIKFILRIISFIISICITTPLFILNAILRAITGMLLYTSYHVYMSYEFPEELMKELPPMLKKILNKKGASYTFLKIWMLAVPPFMEAFRSIHLYMKSMQF